MYALRTLGLGLTLFGAMFFGGLAQAEKADKSSQVMLGIEPQPLGDALNAFGQQSGLQIVFVYSELAQATLSPRLVGRYSPQAALDELLANTQFRYEFLNDRTVAIRRKDAAVSSSPVSSDQMTLARNIVATHPDEGIQKKSDIASDGAGAADDKFQEIVVTGTHIRGQGPVGSKISVIDRAAIDNTGYASVQDVLRNITQNVGAAQAEVTPGGGNFTRGTGFNLRGLGTGATLTLVNGRRQSAGGDGDFVDVDSIPAAAVERIEILSDGASAVYGSDAIGGVVNIILRKDYDGAESRLRYADANGSTEKVLSQTFGRSWNSGGALLGYQYYDRAALPLSSRDFAAADKRAFGGRDFRSPFSNPGNITSPAARPIPAGQNGIALTPASLVAGAANLQDLREGAEILPENKTQSVFFSGQHRLSDPLELSFDGRYSRREFALKNQASFTVVSVTTQNPFYVNPTGGTGPVAIQYNFVDDLGPQVFGSTIDTWTASAGATYRLPSSWRIVASQSYAREQYRFSIDNVLNTTALAAALLDTNPLTAFNPFADGSNTHPATLDKLRSTTTNAGGSHTWQTTLIADGSLFSLAGGEARLAVGADYRQERLQSGAFPAVGHPLGRKVIAGFAEMTLPFVGADNGRPGLRALELSLAGRYDDYSDFGDTTNPRLGLQYGPLQALTLRATWGKSFRAPRLVDLDDQFIGPLSVGLGSFVDPLSSAPSGQSVVLSLSGRNSQLQPERATSWTAGFDFMPAQLPGFHLTATYYDIDYRDKIQIPGPAATSSVLQQAALWPDIIVRGPAGAQLALFCPQLINGSCAATPPTVLVDFRLRNTAILHQRGIDAEIGQVLPTSVGSFQAVLGGTYIFSHEQQASPTSPQADLIDTLLNPVSLRLRALTSWAHREYSVYAGANYSSSYLDNINVPNRHINSWTTVDVGVGYKLNTTNNWLNGTTLSLRASNVFDEAPPFTNTAIGYDATNANPLGRLLSVQLQKVW